MCLLVKMNVLFRGRLPSPSPNDSTQEEDDLYPLMGYFYRLLCYVVSMHYLGGVAKVASPN